MSGQARFSIRWPSPWRLFWLATAVVLAAFGIGVVAPFCYQQAALRAIRSAGGDVSFRPAGPEWLRRRFGNYAPALFSTPEIVWMNDPSRSLLPVTTGGSPPTRSVTDADVAPLARLTDLTMVDLGRTQVTDQGLAQIRGLRQLTALSLDGTAVADGGLEVVAGFPQLSWLVLYDTPIGDSGLSRLAGCTNLKRLVLSRTRVTDSGMACLSGLLQLEELHLSSTRVGDAGLEQVKGLTRLKVLFLFGTPVTDAGLTHLDGLTALEYLNIAGATHVTAEGVSRLKRALPRVSVAGLAPDGRPLDLAGLAQ